MWQQVSLLLSLQLLGHKGCHCYSICSVTCCSVLMLNRSITSHLWRGGSKAEPCCSLCCMWRQLHVPLPRHLQALVKRGNQLLAVGVLIAYARGGKPLSIALWVTLKGQLVPHLLHGGGGGGGA